MLVALYHLQDHARERARRISIADQNVIVGTDPSCAIVIDDDAEVLPRHVRISLHESRFVIVPISRDAVVAIDGVHIARPTVLKPRGTIVVGQTVLRVSLDPVVTTFSDDVARPNAIVGTYSSDDHGTESNPPPPTMYNPPPLRRPSTPPGPPPPAPMPPAKVYRTVLSRDPVEQGFLEQLRATPADHAVRMVYADWLEARGAIDQAAFLQVGRRYNPVAIEQRTAVEWRAIASRPTIWDCARNGCPERWHCLEALPDDEQCRRCTSCNKLVRYCVAHADASACTARHERYVLDMTIADD